MSMSFDRYFIFKNYLCFLTLSIVITKIWENSYITSCCHWSFPANRLWMLTVEAAIIVDSFAYLLDIVLLLS